MSPAVAATETATAARPTTTTTHTMVSSKLTVSPVAEAATSPPAAAGTMSVTSTVTSSTVDKRSAIVHALHEDMLACECLLSFLSGAVMSYRFDSILRPFPPAFVTDGEKDIERLRATFERIPRLAELEAVLMPSPSSSALDTDVLDLLYWCLCAMPFKLRSRDKSLLVRDTQASTERGPGTTQATEAAGADDAVLAAPAAASVDYLLEFEPSEQQQRSFDEARRTTTTMMGADPGAAANAAADPSVVTAYHGTKLENVFSILNCGLLTHMNKVGVFGSGTYLTTEPDVALSFTNRGPIWPRARLGTHLTCVVVCDVLAKHADVRWTPSSEADRQSQSQRRNHSVPDKYILVKNNSALRLRYVMLFATKSARHRDPSSSSPLVAVASRDSRGLRSRLWTLVRNNLSTFVLLVYGIVLLCINLPTDGLVRRLGSILYSNHY